MTPALRQRRLTDDLSVLPDAFERLTYLVALAGQADPVPEADRRPENLVEGCEADLWLTAHEEGGRLTFRSHSEAPAVSALAHLFCTIYSGASREEVLGFQATALDDSGLNRALTPNRQNGARQIVARIKSLAGPPP